MSVSPARIGIATLALSAAGFGGIVAWEGYSPVAYIPVPGDRQTIGFGTTDGVHAGDKITPPQAVQRALKDIASYEGAVKQCIHVPMTQGEYDAAISLSYNIGPRAFCGSTVAKRFNAGRYREACDAFLMWNKFQGRELAGLTKRRQQERTQCLGGSA